MATEIAKGISVEDLELIATRTFDAPIALVFEVMTQAEHMKHWWGPSQYGMIVDRFDFRVGGGYRYIQKDDDGNEYSFHGSYLEIDPPKRFVQTFVFEGAPDDGMLETLDLEEHDGKTTIWARGRASSPEALQAALDSGMTEGMVESYNRLTEYVEKLAKA